MDDPGAVVDEALLEEDAEELYEHASVGYVSSLPNGRIVKVNETLLGWTGHTREELLGGKRLHDLLAPGARIYYETHWAPLLQMQGSVRELAVELVRADGRRLPVLLNSTLVRDAAGEARVVRTTVFDATERRRYEHELLRARADAEARARAALALDHVNDGVLLVARDGRVDVLNPAAERVLGVSAAAIGSRIGDLVPEWEGLAARVPVSAPGEPATAAVVPLARGGHEQWLAVAAVDAGDAVVYTLRDVTADHALEELRGDVVAIVSHELRTPLTGVYGSAQTLLAHGDSLDEDTRRQLLTMVVEQAERLTRIVDEILLTSRLDKEDVEVGSETADPAAVARELVAALPAAQRERVDVAVEDAGVVCGGAVLLGQVLGNVVENALAYSDGRVRVAVGREGGVVRLTVADDGPGIPAAERDRVFEKFYRLDPNQQRGGGGTGLGLYIARHLTERVGGHVTLLPADRGTTVAIELPAA